MTRARARLLPVGRRSEVRTRAQAPPSAGDDKLGRGLKPALACSPSTGYQRFGQGLKPPPAGDEKLGRRSEARTRALHHPLFLRRIGFFQFEAHRLLYLRSIYSSPRLPAPRRPPSVEFLAVRFMVLGLGFGVWGLGCGFQGVQCTVKGGFRVYGVRCRVVGGCRVEGGGCGV